MYLQILIVSIVKATIPVFLNTIYVFTNTNCSIVKATIPVFLNTIYVFVNTNCSIVKATIPVIYMYL